MRSGLSVELAAVPFRFTAGAGEVNRFLPASFPSFRSARAPRWWVGLEQAAVEPDAVGETVTVLGIGENSFRLDGMGVSARVDLVARRAELVIPPSPHALAVVLRHLVPVAVEDGLVFHAALLARGDRAWLCCGASGAGKSTLARLLPEHAHCDEMAAVRWSGDRWRAEALPFWVSRPGQSPLEAVYILRHGELHRRRRLSTAQALRQLSSHLLWPTGSPLALGRALGLLADLTGRVPVFELEFLPRPDVLDVIASPHVSPGPYCGQRCTAPSGVFSLRGAQCTRKCSNHPPTQARRPLPPSHQPPGEFASAPLASRTPRCTAPRRPRDGTR